MFSSYQVWILDCSLVDGDVDVVHVNGELH
jgi:hypothetical protein